MKKTKKDISRLSCKCTCNHAYPRAIYRCVSVIQKWSLFIVPESETLSDTFRGIISEKYTCGRKLDFTKFDLEESQKHSQFSKACLVLVFNGLKRPRFGRACVVLVFNDLKRPLFWKVFVAFVFKCDNSVGSYAKKMILRS